MPRKSSNARKTTIYKLRPVPRLIDLIVEKYVDNPAFEIDQSLRFAEQSCALISGQFAVRNEVEWCQIVQDYVGTSISLRNISASAALIVQLNGNILALTHGLGRHFLRPIHIEQNFGLKFALRVQFLTLALELMTDPHAMYQTGSEATRTIMNRSIFAKLYVDGDTITGHELREPFSVLADAYSVWQGYPQENRHRPRPTPPQQDHRATLAPPHGSTHTTQ